MDSSRLRTSLIGIALTAVACASFLAASPASAADNNNLYPNSSSPVNPPYATGSFVPDPTPASSGLPLYETPSMSNAEQLAGMGWTNMRSYNGGANAGYLHSQQIPCGSNWIAQCPAPSTSSIRVTSDGHVPENGPNFAITYHNDDEYKFIMYRAGNQSVFQSRTLPNGSFTYSSTIMPTYKIVMVSNSDSNKKFSNFDSNNGLIPASVNCIDADAGLGAVGANTRVQTYGCDAGGINQDNQAWVFLPDNVHTDGYYIVNVSTLRANPYTDAYSLPRMSVQNTSTSSLIPANESAITLQNPSPSYSQAFSFHFEGTFRWNSAAFQPGNFSIA